VTGNSKGFLSVVGSGIRPGGQLTIEARNLISGADQVFAQAGDALGLAALAKLNPDVVSLQQFYACGKQRDKSYQEMIEVIMEPVRQGKHVCAVFYGHPGVFVWPSHGAIRRARSEGFEAVMYPGISAEDCLFADLGFDPAVYGCQSFEATDFLLHARSFDPTAALILWQPITLGDLGRNEFRCDPAWVRILAEVLLEQYPAGHEVIIYEASTFALNDPRIESLPLERLHEAEFTEVSTLYIPPARAPVLSPERLARLGVDESDITFGSYQKFRQG
jgi:uncharacterized protein YabN with tetrapyrrole methylase and pyrophosphatase domain